MKVMLMIVVVIGGCAILFGAGHMVRRRGRLEEDEIESVHQPHIRVLRTREELQEALARAAEAERGIAEVVTARADRYEASIRPRPAPISKAAEPLPINKSTDATPAEAKAAEPLPINRATGATPAGRRSA